VIQLARDVGALGQLPILLLSLAVGDATGGQGRGQERAAASHPRDRGDFTGSFG
jgi:hypothetical protein